MEKKILAVVVVAFLLLAFTIIPIQEPSDRTSISDWAATNNHVVSNIDRHHFDVGPFWYSKNCRIYKVQVEDGKTFWFRFRFWGTDIEER